MPKCPLSAFPEKDSMAGVDFILGVGFRSSEQLSDKERSGGGYEIDRCACDKKGSQNQRASRNKN
jgi:hypothetical protein